MKQKKELGKEDFRFLLAGAIDLIFIKIHDYDGYAVNLRENMAWLNIWKGIKWINLHIDTDGSLSVMTTDSNGKMHTYNLGDPIDSEHIAHVAITKWEDLL